MMRTTDKIIHRNVFDFELGYLTKSPCLNCKNRSNLPKCHKGCLILDQIQTRLARGISSMASTYRS